MTPQQKYVKAHPDRVKVSKEKYAKKNRRKILAFHKKRRTTEEYRKKQRDYMLAKTYGISQETYNEMLAIQGNVCFVCRQAETRLYKGKPTNLVVDHNHQTGEIRRILCHACNAALGFLDENPDRMRYLADYVDQFNKRTDDGRPNA